MSGIRPTGRRSPCASARAPAGAASGAGRRTAGPIRRPGPGSRVVLTVAHLGVARPDGTAGDKHDKMDVRDENLAALCQRCHLRYDIREHMVNAAATRRRKREASGQMVMFDGLEVT